MLSLQEFKADLFKAIGHPVRIRVFELLRLAPEEGKTVTELQAALGIEASSVSQQLAVLRNRGLVSARKEGSNVYYSVPDSHVFELLDTARAIFNQHLESLQAMSERQDAAE